MIEQPERRIDDINAPDVEPWTCPPDPVILDVDDAHVWRIPYIRYEHLLDELYASLSEDERERADRFRRDCDRIGHIISHGMLRRILSRYCGGAPERLSFRVRPQGKPECDSGGDIEFNLTHTQGMALCAVAKGRAIGVDVEMIGRRVSNTEVAERFFAPNECAQLRDLPREQQHEAFLRCWTRKEAYIKARGGGLRIPLDSFEVSLLPDYVGLLSAKDDDAGSWRLFSVRPWPGYIGAVAVQSPCERLLIFE